MATNKKMNPLDEKFKNEHMKIVPIKNKYLICSDCKKNYYDTYLP